MCVAYDRCFGSDNLGAIGFVRGLRDKFAVEAFVPDLGGESILARVVESSI